MMELKTLFSGIDADEFVKRFSTDENCLEFLASVKWELPYRCKKCGHNNHCKGKSPFSKRCTRCKHEESATAHTPFHGCRMPLTLAFKVAYQVCCEPQISSYKLAEKHNIRQMTSWKLKNKVLKCLTSGQDS